LKSGPGRVENPAPEDLPLLIERFNVAAQGATEHACRVAVKAGHRFVAPSHLFQVLVEDKEGPVRRWLALAEAGLETLEGRIQTRLAAQERAPEGAQSTPINRGLEAVFIHAEEAATALGNRYIGLNHLALGLLEDGQVREDLLGTLPRPEALGELKDALRAGSFQGAPGLDAYDALSKYGVDLTARARAGRLDRVVGREAELRQVIQVLSRRLKNNPVIVGEPGVGKTAVVEGLAQRIAEGLVPANLRDHLVVTLDVGSLLAGTKFRGEFEERFKQLMAEVAEAGNIILFIDELHMLVGAGGQEGGTDASNLLKPALSRGEVRCIGSTTLREYRKRIEKDSALSRRFQLVLVEEPTPEQATTILRGLKETYEVHHGVRITDAAIHAAVRLSRRYITDRFLPDKAIDLIDQAAANIRMELASRPEEIEQLSEEVVRLQIEIRALEQDNEGQPTEASTAKRAEVAALEAERDALVAVWEAERRSIQEIQEAKRDLEEARREVEQRLREEDYERVAELQYKVVPERTAHLEALQGEGGPEVRFLRQEVLERDVAEAVSRATGIPVAKLVDAEAERLLQAEALLGARVVGQGEAVAQVAKALRRARAGVQDPNRPLASFLFLGPTGVGKTELTKALADFMFDSERALVRLDMSEYMEKHSVARLVGAPPGYIGHDEGSALANTVRRKPYCVVLFDEVEKAHPDVFNVLLQVLDEGHMTDGQGTAVDFKNTVIILTSNLGAKVEPGASQEALRTSIMAAVRRHFRPEFINRLDDLIVFAPLDKEAMRPIARLQVERVAALLRERSIGLELSDAAVEHLAEIGFDPEYGARPLKRAIRAELQDQLAEALIRGRLVDSGVVRVDARDGRLAVEVVATPAEDAPPSEADAASADGGA
jgi:ATP-dependent Clp protease ATP-binding subunit ClpB